MPTTAQSNVGNERQLVRAFFGTEAQLGTLVVPTFKMYGDLRLHKARPLVDRLEHAGTYFQDYNPARGPIVVDGTYVQSLYYEDLPILLRYGVVGGDAPVADGNPTIGYTRTQKPSAVRKDIDFASAEYFIQALPYQATGIHWTDFTISADPNANDTAWQFNARVLALTRDLKADTAVVATSGTTTTIVKTAAGWTVNQFQGAVVRATGGTAGNLGQEREVLSNDATTLTLAAALPAAVVAADAFLISGVFTPAIPDRTREQIAAPGTIVYKDVASPIGTTQVKQRVISWSLTYTNNSFGKRFMEDTLGYSRYGFGMTRVTGQLRLEFDRRDQIDEWLADTAVKLRFKQTGSAINVGPNTFKTAQIDLTNVQWDTDDENQDNQNNLTQVLGFKAMVDTTVAAPITFVSVNKLATLP